MKKLGKKIKEDYPGDYDDLSDKEVGRLYLEKFPHMALESGGRTELQKAMRQLDNRPRQQANTGLERNVESLIDKYDSDRGSLASWIRKLQSQGRGKHLEALNEEQRQLIDQAVMMEKAVMEGRKDAAEFNTILAQNANFFLVLEAASEQKLPPDVYAEIRRHEEIARIDLDKTFAEQREAVRLAILSESMSEHQKIFLLQELLDVAYKEIHEIETRSLPDHIKTRMIQDREETISTLKEDRRARQARLLQANNGEEI